MSCFFKYTLRLNTDLGTQLKKGNTGPLHGCGWCYNNWFVSDKKHLQEILMKRRRHGAEHKWKQGDIKFMSLWHKRLDYPAKTTLNKRVEILLTFLFNQSRFVSGFNNRLTPACVLHTNISGSSCYFWFSWLWRISLQSLPSHWIRLLLLLHSFSFYLFFVKFCIVMTLTTLSDSYEQQNRKYDSFFCDYGLWE